MDVEKKLTMDEVKQKALNLFFPNGSARYLPFDAENVTSYLANFNGERMNTEMTVDEYYRKHTWPFRVYLCMKSVIKVDEDEDECE